eukprot:Sspe_Gene.18882::Locus_6825_Transcript_2_2_Confidence_0.600_Length_2428::g.18882::m.18882
MSWSTDLRKEHAECEEVWKFDQRPSYMNYEFECRTLDNVELIVDVTFFWRIIDVRAMIEGTADAPGDACTHARSMILQQISKVKLMDFLETFNELIRDSCLGDPFYQDRGIELLSVEVLKFECASQETNGILQEIIRETCDRLKNKERQRGGTRWPSSASTARSPRSARSRSSSRSASRTSAPRRASRARPRVPASPPSSPISPPAPSTAPTSAATGPSRSSRCCASTISSSTPPAPSPPATPKLYLLPDQVNLNLGTLHNPPASSL